MKKRAFTLPGRTRPHCCYCKRELVSATPERSNSYTRDHIHPEALGGGRWVPCCRACNQLKADLPTTDWLWFIDHHPRWWKTFATSDQVERVIREHRFAEAMARREAAE